MSGVCQILPDTCQIFYRYRFSLPCRNVGKYIHRSQRSEIFILGAIWKVNYGIIITWNFFSNSSDMYIYQSFCYLCNVFWARSVFGIWIDKKENLETNVYFFLARNENGEKCFTDIYVDWNDDCNLAGKWFHCIYRLLCI